MLAVLLTISLQLQLLAQELTLLGRREGFVEVTEEFAGSALFINKKSKDRWTR